MTTDRRYRRAQEKANRASEIEQAHWDNVGCVLYFVEEWAAVMRTQLEEAREKLKEIRKEIILYG